MGEDSPVDGLADSAERRSRLDRVRESVAASDRLRRSQYVSSLGFLFVLVAAVHAGLELTSGGPPPEVTLDLALVSLPGLSLLYVGSQLSATEFDPAFYSRIATWCVAGVGVMLVFLALRAAHPGVAVHWTFGTQAIALSLGCVAGLAIGLHEAEALTRQQELERRNEAMKRARLRLEERNDELEATREQLRDTVQELEASNDRLDQFAAAASHDLREPLRMVISYLQLLDDRHADELDDDAAEFLEFALDGADRMGTLVEDLLQYSRIEATDVTFEPVDLDAVLDDVRADLQVRIEESNAELTAGELPRVEGDASQLRRLLQNLVSNAIEYAGEEPPRIHVSAEQRGDEQVLSVADEGIGIDADDQERAFAVFERLHARSEHDGSGVGLAVCQSIVEHHGGDLWVESEPGEGATFSVSIPAARVEAEQRTVSFPE